MNSEITLTAPVTITFTPQQIQLVVQALHEMPYKFAQPLIEHIVSAIKPLEST